MMQSIKETGFALGDTLERKNTSLLNSQEAYVGNNGGLTAVIDDEDDLDEDDDSLDDDMDLDVEEIDVAEVDDDAVAEVVPTDDDIDEDLDLDEDEDEEDDL